MGWRRGGVLRVGPVGVCLAVGICLAVHRGITLPLMRIGMLLGILHMSLAQGRAAEILALIAPLLLAAPLARQIGGVDASNSPAAPMRGALLAGLAAALVAGTV